MIIPRRVHFQKFLPPAAQRWVSKLHRAPEQATAGSLVHSQACGPIISLAACFLLLVTLLGLARSDLTKERWQLVTAQTLVPVDTADFDIDGFKKRIGGVQQLELEYELASMLTPSKGEIHDNLECVAQNIYFEARNEPRLGKIAVGHVVLNRVRSEIFPDTPCEVVRQGGEKRRHRCQFSWWCDGKSDEPKNFLAWTESMHLARDVVWGRVPDPTEGALWYHAEYVKPKWRKAFHQGPKIGRHLFYTRRATPPRPQLAAVPKD